MPISEHHARWLEEVLAGMIAATGIGYLATTYSISRWLTRTTQGEPEILPCSKGLSWEPLECHTSDNLKLSGWVVSPENPSGTVVLFHGLRCNRVHILDRVCFLSAAGYRCVAFDHRAHGQSDGTSTSFGYYESQDVLAILDLVKERWPTRPCAALGVSMGAAALCYAAAKGARYDAVILESMYHDLDSAFNYRIGGEFPAWFRYFAGGVIWITERRLKVKLQQLTPANFISKIAPSPILLLTGSEDTFAGPDDLTKLRKRCQSPSELFVINGAGHVDVY